MDLASFIRCKCFFFTSDSIPAHLTGVFQKNVPISPLLLKDHKGRTEIYREGSQSTHDDGAGMLLAGILPSLFDNCGYFLWI